MKDVPFVEVTEAQTHEQVGYYCINCDTQIDPNTGSMYCSEACELEFNEDLKAELEDLREVFQRYVLSD